MSETSAWAAWDFEIEEYGQVSLKAGESVMIQEEGSDGWSTVEKKGGETGFVPTCYLERSKAKRKGTLFGKKKGSSDPAPAIPPFGTSTKKKDDGGNKGTRRFATARRGSSKVSTTLADLGARYGEDDPTAASSTSAEESTPAAEATPEPVADKPPLPPKQGRNSGSSADADAQPKGQPPPAVGGPAGTTAPPVRSKISKLAAKFEGGNKAPKKSGPKKIMVKGGKRPPQSPLVPPSSDPLSPKRTPVSPPPKPTSPRRNSAAAPLSASAPNFPKVDNARNAATVRASEPPKELVSTETLEELAKMNDRRTNIVREIYETEKSYVRNLKEICTLYMTPMKESKWRDHVQKLFSNVHLIVTINDELLEGLSGAIETWNAETSLVGPIFQKMAPFMRLYNTYGNSYNDALAVLHQLKSKSEFCEWLQARRGTQPLDLEALLIQPVQRIPRYRLLLEDLFKNTPSAHPDRPTLESSLKNIQDVATAVNESIRATEQAKKIGEQTGLQKYIAPHRKLLSEQTFSAKVAVLGGDKLKGATDVALFLFNDLLVMFFQKVVKMKDSRRYDFTELAWPHTLMWPSLEKKGQFRVIGPGVSILFTSKEKDSTSAASQVAGFHQRLVDVCNSEIPESAAGRAKKPEVRTAGTNFGVYEFAEGIHYQGEWKDGLPHGKGTQTLVGGLVVEGSFEEGLKHGECTITYPTGEVYTGSCMKDDQHGIGQIVWPNGDTYKGYWLGGRRDGEGTFTCAHYQYVGNWSDGLMDGEGKLTFNSGGWYQGKFKEGKFHGEGQLLRSSGVFAKGAWANGTLEGEAEEFYPESMPLKAYAGMFRNDRRDGAGTMLYRDGSQYKGEWKDGVRHGKGILTCPNRPIMRYEGSWAADRFDGRGEVFFSTRDRYAGGFLAGSLNGQGVYTFSNGAQITGEWRNGIRQRKMGLSRTDSTTNERFDVELTGSKECVELGDAKYNGKLLSYFIPPARPELEQSLLEMEVVAETECNLLKGDDAPRKSNIALEEGASDSPRLSSAAGKTRTTSFLGALKRK